MNDEDSFTPQKDEAPWQEWTAADDHSRLDACVVSHFPELTRSKIQKLIEREKILLNKAKTKASQKIRTGDLISIQIEAEPINIGIMPEDIPLDVVYEDDELVIVNKPAGMVVHPAQGNWSGTLVNALMHRYGEQNLSTGVRVVNVHQDLRPGIVHRIDKNTSGLLVVAKNDGAQIELGKQFHDHSIHRRYYGICWGVLPEKGEWKGKIGRDPGNRQRMAINEKGKTATTRFRRIESFKIASLFEAELETGRTHQIRVHFSHNGFPLIGDGMYLNSTRPARRNKEAAMRILRKADIDFARRLESIANEQGRQMLHAKELGFIHPLSGERVRFDSELPKDFEDVLADFRQFSVQYRA